MIALATAVLMVSDSALRCRIQMFIRSANMYLFRRLSVLCVICKNLHKFINLYVCILYISVV